MNHKEHEEHEEHEERQNESTAIPKLLELLELKGAHDDTEETDETDETDKDHGRLEVRRDWITEELGLGTLSQPERWKGLRSIGRLSGNQGLSKKRRKATWNDDYRAKVVFG